MDERRQGQLAPGRTSLESLGLRILWAGLCAAPVLPFVTVTANTSGIVVGVLFLALVAPRFERSPRCRPLAVCGSVASLALLAKLWSEPYWLGTVLTSFGDISGSLANAIEFFTVCVLPALLVWSCLQNPPLVLQWVFAFLTAFAYHALYFLHVVATAERLGAAGDFSSLVRDILPKALAAAVLALAAFPPRRRVEPSWDVLPEHQQLMNS